MLARPLRALVVLLAASASTGVSATTFDLRSELPPEIHGVEPASGRVLTGGSLGYVAWSSSEENQPGGFVEWEAFLSLDGGQTYPFRITPHLDTGVRRLAFRVPSLPTRTARLLLRFGNGRQEIAVPLPYDFLITPPLLPAVELAFPTSGGEAATPLLASVSSWVDGTPAGRNLIHRRAAHGDFGADEHAQLSREEDPAALEENPPSAGPRATRPQSPVAPPSSRRTATRPLEPTLPQVPPLLRTNRRNE